MKITIEVICHGRLHDLVADIRSHPECYPVLPLDVARANTHSANPNADPDDPALLLVRAGGLCRGYLGLMPQSIAGVDGPHKVFAFSTLLVDAPMRGTGVADQLLECARQFGPLLTLGNSHAAQAFFRKRGLLPLPAYHVAYLQLGAGYWLSRAQAGMSKRLEKRGMRSLSNAVEAGSSLLRPLAALLRKPKAKSLREKLPTREGRRAEHCPRIPAEVADVLPTQFGRVQWQVESLNWLLDENTRIQARHPGLELAGNYHFHCNNYRRRYAACLLRERGKVVGLAMFHCHYIHGQETVTILHAFVPDKGWYPMVLDFGLHLAITHQADVVRAGVEFEKIFSELGDRRPVPTKSRCGFVDAPAGSHVFDHYQESFDDGDIALY